ncbi:AzlD domain-containing protein [Bacillus kwashiorkori]|uniref:AzlD domain-containing protein n=1 Tax=Bacillus kwashiorkori TaxID=1522318 RepID=UPI000780A770|nr:AzlD domain-containing protein [Bacillus kwashiorkori]
MTSSAYLTIILLASVATYLTRLPGLVLGRYIKLTPRLKRGLDFVPIGVFAALVGPTIFLQPKNDGYVDWQMWLATGLATLVAFVTKSPLWTMIAGVVGIAVFRIII